MDNQTKLTNLRHEIDVIDHKLLEMLTKRLDVVDEIGRLKNEMKLLPLDENRWAMVLKDRMSKGEKLGLDKEFVERIYMIIHDEALKREASLIF
jgi:chorismate mutase